MYSEEKHVDNYNPYCDFNPRIGWRDRVTGNYEIVGNKEFDPITKQYNPTFKMVIKEYLKTPITGEMFANLAK